MTRPQLYINHLAEYDWLVALEFGRVDDSQPPDNWRGVSEDFGFLHEEPGGRVVGFKVLDFSEFDAEDEAVAEITVSAPLWKGYKKNRAASRAALHDFCTRRGVNCLFTSNQVPFDKLVLSYLRQRGLVR